MAQTHTMQNREQCIELVKQGYSSRRIAEDLGMPLTTVRRYTAHLESLKPTIKRPYLRYSAETPPAPLPPSASLAYLTGVFAGDGCLTKMEQTVKLAILCDVRYPHLIERYQALVKELTGLEPTIQKRAAGTWVEVRLYNRHLPVLFGFPTGDKRTNGFTVPEWIFEQKEYIRNYVRGLIETDGGIYRTYHKGGTFTYCCFTARNMIIMDSFLRATSLLDYTFILKGYDARLSRSAEVERLADELGITKIREYSYSTKHWGKRQA